MGANWKDDNDLTDPCAVATKLTNKSLNISTLVSNASKYNLRLTITKYNIFFISENGNVAKFK